MEDKKIITIGKGTESLSKVFLEVSKAYNENKEHKIPIVDDEDQEQKKILKEVLGMENKKQAIEALKKEAMSQSVIFKDPNFMPSRMWDKENNKPISITYKRNVKKINRNEPCPCKSGRKFKHCHGK